MPRKKLPTVSIATKSRKNIAYGMREVTVCEKRTTEHKK
jgi:hypothetical protein